MKYINGQYRVRDKIFSNKVYAMIEATKLNADISYSYFDEIFDKANFNFGSADDIDLRELYRQRAQQLRDQYDYLILNYSGGSDSHNILETFLKYNIKLDVVYVQWPEKLMDKGLYTPNSIDKSNANFHSEWDLVLKKDLEWLGKNRPDIKIEIGDWTTSVKEEFYTDDLFLTNVSNLPSIARSQKQNTFSKYETQWANQGKKVANIFGVDKTTIVKKGKEWFFYFADTTFMAQPNPENPNGLEYFYHTPSFPEIPIVQAKKLVNWYKLNTQKQYLVKAWSERIVEDPTWIHWPYEKHYAEFSEVAEIFKLVCYPYWNFGRFQADKPFAKLEGFKLGTRAWDNILTAIPNFDRVQQKWEYNWNSYLKQIDKKFMRANSKDTVNVFKTKWHLLRTE